MAAAAAAAAVPGQDGEFVGRHERLLQGLLALVDAEHRDGIVQRLHALDDALSIALQRTSTSTATAETPVLRNMRARINAVLSPLETLKAELAQLAVALTPYQSLAETLDEHHRLLEQRAALLDRRELDLAEHRRTLAQREDTLRADEAALTRSLDASAQSVQSTTTELGALRSRARAAEESLYQKDARLRAATRDLADAQADAARLQNLSAQLEKDAGRSGRAANRQASQAKRDLLDALDELEAHRAKVGELQEALGAERRKGRSLQSSLRLQLTQGDRGRTLLGGTLPAGSLSRSKSAAAVRSSARAAQTATDYVELKMKIRDQEETIKRLQAQNKDLLRHAKDTNVDAHVLRAQVSTNVSDRAELVYRLEKLTHENRYLQDQLRKHAEKMVKQKRLERQRDEQRKWSRIKAINSAPSRRSEAPLPLAVKSRSIRVQNW